MEPLRGACNDILSRTVTSIQPAQSGGNGKRRNPRNNDLSAQRSLLMPRNGINGKRRYPRNNDLSTQRSLLMPRSGIITVAQGVSPG